MSSHDPVTGFMQMALTEWSDQMDRTDSGLLLPGSKSEESEERLELLPSEDYAIRNAINEERTSYSTEQEFHNVESRDDLIKAIRGFAVRVQNRIAEVGFEAIVSCDLNDPENFDFYGDALDWHPTVNIIRRISKTSGFDYERKAHEVRHGLADGKIGRMKANGEWTDDPDRVHVIR